MQDIQIIWNGQQLDYYSNSDNALPLTFNKKIDDWLNFFGNFGTTGADFADTLEIPATKKNSLILFNSDDPTAYNLFVHIQSADFIINLGYFMLFKGRAELVNTAYQGTVPTSFSLRIQGAAADIWAQLEDKTMNDIDMGVSLTTDADIIASWTPLSNTSNPILWPLVNYGGRMVTNNYMQTTFWDYDNGIRPSVRIWWAMKSIFEQFGYTVEGELYNSQMFRNLVELYTNGDDWTRADNWVDFFCNVAVSTLGGSNVVADGDIITYLDETSVGRTDPQGINSGFFAPYNSLAMVAMGGAWFEFEFYFSKSTGGAVLYQFELSDNLFSSTEIIAQLDSSSAEGQAIYRLAPIWFSNSVNSNRWVLRVRALNLTTPGAPIIFNTSTYYAAKMTNRFNFGGVLQISSCFQAKPVKDFLAGVAQFFGGVYYVDNILRRVTFEPRFVRDLGQTFPDYNRDISETYYRIQRDSIELETDQNGLSLSNNKPFGDNLEIFMKRDSDDPIYKLYLDIIGTTYNNDTVPLYSTSIELADVNKEKKTFENAYYSPTINSKFQFTADNPYSNGLYYPTIIETADQIKISNLDYTNGIKATYKGSPRIAVYYGLLDFTGIAAGTNQWAYQQFSIIGPILDYNVPSVFQIFPDSADYFALVTTNPFNLAYPTYFYAVPSAKVIGLIEYYYSKYLAMVIQDKIVTVRARMPLSDYAMNDFRTSRWLNIGGQKVKCWIIEIANYNPLESEFADFTLVVDTDLIRGITEYGTTSNQQRPVLLMRNDINILEDGTF